MKVNRADGYISVESPALVSLGGFISAGIYGAKHARAMAFWPLIIFRNREQMQPWIFNHEKIHLRQQADLFLVGHWLLFIAEFTWIVFFKRRPWADFPVWNSGEQEAYRNQQDFEYLKNRKRFAQFWYLTHKREFIFGKPGEIVFNDAKAKNYDI
ncbi:MAG: hypothetical protein ACREGH_02580 [Minisyncoccia bacterium]